MKKSATCPAGSRSAGVSEQHRQSSASEPMGGPQNGNAKNGQKKARIDSGMNRFGLYCRTSALATLAADVNICNEICVAFVRRQTILERL
ncbi:hypothetical protein [Comamonas piscis]